MKKIYTLVILLSMGITQIYAQCFQCNDTTKAFSIGTNTNAKNYNSFAGGIISNANGENSFVFGSNSTVNGLGSIGFGTQVTTQQDGSIAIGNNLISNALYSYTFGRYLTATGNNSITIGTGSSGAPLVNNKEDCIMFGVTEFPALTIVKPKFILKHNYRGYIGMGTDDPKEMVHVVGTLLIERTGETTSSLQFKHPETTRGIDPGTGGGGTNPTPPPYYWDIYSDTYGLKFNTVEYGISNPTTSQNMVISRSGFVGIGTNAPQAKLHVGQNIIADENITTLNKFVLSPASNSKSDYWEVSRSRTGLNYAYMDRALQNVLFMGNDGSIGVGTTAPAAMLDVNGSFSAQSATIPTITGNTNITGTLSANEFEVTDLTISQNAIVNGSLGIGTDHPKDKLHVVNGNILISKTTSSETEGSLIFDDCKISDSPCVGTYHIWGIQYHHSNRKNGLEFWNNAAGIQTKTGEGDEESTRAITSALFLANNNNVGIGTSNPQVRLDVDGSFQATNANINGALTASSATINGAANVTGTLTANSATINGAANVTGALTANSAKITGEIRANSAEIKGKIKAQEIEVTLDVKDWPDFVFENDYTLMTLQETEDFIKENKHLPNVPSAAEVEANGVNLGEMNAILIQKVEELTLYILDLQKQINELKTK